MAKDYFVNLITENVDDGIIFISKDHLIKIFNSAAVRYSGVSSSQALDKEFTTIMSFNDKDQQTVKSLIDESLQNHDSPLYHQTILHCTDNIDLPIIYRIVVSLDESNKVNGCLFVFRDYQFDRYKTDFLSLVAHQLKTPLGSMRWNLEALLSLTDLPKSTSDVVRDVYNCNTRLISLVDDLLNASRIDSRKVISRLEPTSISGVINNSLKELSYQVEQKNLTLSVNIGYQDNINIDSKHLREVVQNLLSNSIKYNRVGGTINITVQPIEDHLEVSIGDTGIGIPNEELPRIFSRSFRAQNAIDTQMDGSGLGLYVAKSFVEDWGGQISCQSTVNQGTTITFTIPLVPLSSKLSKNLII